MMRILKNGEIILTGMDDVLGGVEFALAVMGRDDKAEVIIRTVDGWITAAVLYGDGVAPLVQDQPARR